MPSAYIIFIMYLIKFNFYFPSTRWCFRIIFSGPFYASNCVDVPVHSVVCANFSRLVYNGKTPPVPGRASGTVRISCEQNICNDKLVGELLDTRHRNDNAVLSNIQGGRSTRTTVVPVSLLHFSIQLTLSHR